MITSKEIGKIFTKKREDRKLSIEDVCRMSRIQQSVIKDIENGVFDRLSKPYLKGFLKKYSTFLGLDAEDVLKKYEEVSLKVPSREFNLGEDRKKQKDVFFDNRVKRNLKVLFIAGSSVIFVILFFMLLGAIRKSLTRLPSRENAASISVKKKPAVRKKSKKVKKPVAAASTTHKKASAPVVLTLKARDDVWVKITDGEKMLFAGIIGKGGARTWKADGPLKVWTGKGESLDFTVNTRKIGVVAAGVVKNISVSSRGVKVGDVWTSRFDV